MRTVTTRLVAAAITVPTLSGITLVASAPVNAAPVSAARVGTADIADLKDKVSNLENKVANLEKKANKANNKLDKADASLSKAKDALAKANKRQKKAAKKLDRAESDADAARHDLGLVQFGANLARNLEIRDDSDETQHEDNPGLIDVANDDDYTPDQPSLVNLSVEASAAERDATMSAVQADWMGAGARADLREAAQAVKRAKTKRDEVAEARKKAGNAASNADKKLADVEDRLANVESKLSTAVEEKRAAERKREAEKAARAAANRTARPGTGHTTSPYGMRTHPITGVHKLHTGTDFSYGDGRAYAARSGTVAAVTYDGAYGNMVTLSHGNGLQTRYAHLASPSVSVGESVSAGDVVGQIGSTGYSTGAHLHFEVLENGEFVNADSWLGQ